MAVRSGFPIITTGDLDELVRFYEAAFDAERTFAFPDDLRDAYVALRLGDAELGIGRADADAVPGAVAIWLYVDDVDEQTERALAAGASLAHPPADMPWGERVAELRDPAGVRLHLGAPIA